MSGRLITGRVEAQVEPFVKAIGLEATALLLLRLGGAEMLWSRSPKKSSRLSKAIGHENAQALGSAALDIDLPRRVPLGNLTLARFLRARGKSVASIARTIRTSDVAVRDMLRSDSELRERTPKSAARIEQRKSEGVL